MGMVFIVGCITGLALVDSPYGGRKIQLLGASLFMGPPLLVAAFTHFADGPGSITAIMVFIFSFGFQAAWGIIPWFYPAELFQMKERERALSISTFCGFFLTWLSAWSPRHSSHGAKVECSSSLDCSTSPIASLSWFALGKLKANHWKKFQHCLMGQVIQRQHR